MDSTLISTRPDEGTLSLSRARRAALGSFAGAVVDWYDFLLYGITAALVFNREFFPQVSPAMGTLAAFATFGVGFLFRPLGGVIFGHFGDRLGRKRMLMLTVWMMGIATALIGILPSFSTIGWWAPILLVTLRAIQGFAVGGEWGGAALLSVESAPKNKKAFYSSGVQVGYGVGLLLSTGLVSLISMMTTDEQFLSWGWRIPFLFSIVLVLGALWVRNGMEESAEFEQQQHNQAAAKKRIPVIEALLRHPGAFLKIIALRLCELLTMYIVTAFALNYSTQNMGLPRELFLNIGLLVEKEGRMPIKAVWMMGIATALIGILPSFSTIGWCAPILLVTLRAIQGFAVGGEWGGAALLSVESAPKNKKAFYSSGVQVGYGVGLLLSTGLVSLISMMTTDEQFLSWGWRIPFLFSIVLVLGALWVRNGMEESAEFEQQQHNQAAAKKRIPVIEALLRHPGAFLKIIALRLCELLTMYIVTAFALNYSTQNMGLPRELFLNIGLLVGGLSCLTIPCFAWLADRFGRRRVYITGALIGTLSAFPFFMALEAQSIFWIVFFSIMLANIAHDMVVCVQQPMFTEMFGASYRYSGAGVGYQVASVVGGGFTPFIAAALITYFAGNWHSVAIYLLAGCLISAMTALLMKDNQRA